jgi:hypothetical protein
VVGSGEGGAILLSMRLRNGGRSLSFASTVELDAAATSAPVEAGSVGSSATVVGRLGGGDRRGLSGAMLAIRGVAVVWVG